MTESFDSIPVTILTGFLGAGKTTLVNRILTVEHGKRIAVIENEFGEVGIDDALVIDTDEEIFEMNNGCICCTVRGDLIRILTKLARRRDRFDYILIETTGLADPGPVAQTFFMDPDIADHYRLDGIVTVVDAKHVTMHLDDNDECQEQIAFADVILLNKTDLVDDEPLDELERRIGQMNSAAQMHRTEEAEIALDHILDIGAFDLDRTLDADPDFLSPGYPFEWAGVADVDAGSYWLRAQSGPDPHMSMVVRASQSPDGEVISEQQEVAMRLYSHPVERVGDGQRLTPGDTHWKLSLERGAQEFQIEMDQPGRLAIFAEHTPEEFAMVFCDTDDQLVEWTTQHYYEPDHEHDDQVSSVAFETDRPFDAEKLQQWLSYFLMLNGEDIFRMKGIIAVDGMDSRMVFQGVHMLFDARTDIPWGDKPRRSQMVFIGRHLDPELITSSLEQCLA